MIVSYNSAKVTQPFPGITRRILANSDNLMLTEHTLEKGALLPDHNHPQEQLVYLLSGRILLEMNGIEYKMAAGDSLDIPANLNHKVTTLDKSVALDIFTPARKDYV